MLVRRNEILITIVIMGKKSLKIKKSKLWRVKNSKLLNNKKQFSIKVDQIFIILRTKTMQISNGVMEIALNLKNNLFQLLKL